MKKILLVVFVVFVVSTIFALGMLSGLVLADSLVENHRTSQKSETLESQDHPTPSPQPPPCAYTSVVDNTAVLLEPHWGAKSISSLKRGQAVLAWIRVPDPQRSTDRWYFVEFYSAGVGTVSGWVFESSIDSNSSCKVADGIPQ